MYAGFIIILHRLAYLFVDFGPSSSACGSLRCAAYSVYTRACDCWIFKHPKNQTQAKQWICDCENKTLERREHQLHEAGRLQLQKVTVSEPLNDVENTPQNLGRFYLSVSPGLVRKCFVWFCEQLVRTRVKAKVLV